MNNSKNNMEKFISEVLPSAYNNTIYADGDEFTLYNEDDEYIVLTKEDIARMYGIAYPEKRHDGTCCNVPQQTDVSDINVGDMSCITRDKYEERVREVAEEMAISNYKEFVTSFIETNTWESLDDYGKEMYINSCMGVARIAVAHMAEEFKAGYSDVYDFTTDPEYGHDVIKQMIERGLIPAQEGDPSGPFAMGPGH